MRIPTRILRAVVDDLPNGRPIFSARELEQKERILTFGTALMIRFGRAGLAFNEFAIAIRLSPAAIRRHFVDIDALLGEILLRHLRNIIDAVSKIPPGTANRAQKQRAAYLAETRAPFGGPTGLHELFLRERKTVPPDIAEPLETLRLILGELMATPDEAPILLTLLDTHELSIKHIERMFSAIAPPRARAGPTPHQSPNIAAPRSRDGPIQKRFVAGVH